MHKQGNVLANNQSLANTAVGSLQRPKMIDRENSDGTSDGGYNKLISQEDVTGDEHALHSIQEKQQGRNPTIGIPTYLLFVRFNNIALTFLSHRFVFILTH